MEDHGPPPAPTARPPVQLENRAEAGRLLADRLERLQEEAPLVLGIPRGGVPVAFEIARRLQAELDLLLVRKVGAPGDPEYGLGAVAEDGLLLLDEPRARAAGFSRANLEPVIQQERAEIAKRAALFRGGKAPPRLSGRTVVVVDDGVATGGTVRTAIAVVRIRKPRSVVVALGVAPPEALADLGRLADEVVVAVVPPHLEAVGQWYRHFEPVEDQEVLRLLSLAPRISSIAP